MAHKLKLFIRDSSLDAKSLLVSDVSQYDDRIDVANHALHIQLPGFDDALAVQFTIGETTAYNSRNLQLCPGDAEPTDLPDGLYTLTYSVAPNSKVFTTVYHFRTVKLQQQVYQRIAKLHNCPDPHSVDDCGNVILQKEEQILVRALLLLDSLKADLCLHSDYNAALNNYNEVQKMLSSVNCGC